MPELNCAALIRFAVKFRDLGDSVSDQVADLILRDDRGFNPNAIRLAYDKLRGVDDELDEILEEALEQGPNEDDCDEDEE